MTDKDEPFLLDRADDLTVFEEDRRVFLHRRDREPEDVLGLLGCRVHPAVPGSLEICVGARCRRFRKEERRGKRSRQGGPGGAAQAGKPARPFLRGTS